MIDPKTVRYAPGRRDKILRRIKALSPWYHKIDLGDGIVTPGREFDRLWKSTTKVLDAIDYRDKRVLDLASWDGYWAFEAERRGAKRVISSDIRLEGYANLLFAREILESKVIPFCNVPVQDLPTRLRVVGLDSQFDIVHHFGLFYHLRDPLLSLAQTRAVMPEGGLLVLETAFIDDDEKSYMAFSGLPGKFHFYGISDTWAPTRLCLREILIRSQFEPVQEAQWSTIPATEAAVAKGELAVGRITMLAKAVGAEGVHAVDVRKIMGIQ
jgi:tRNA (mo5U34)-methyltransferase